METIVEEIPEEEKIQMIMRQTDYDEKTASDKLEFFDYDHIKVIKDFLGVKEKKSAPIKSLNQEIYKQIRSKMDVGIVNYNNKQYEKIDKDLQR